MFTFNFCIFVSVSELGEFVCVRVCFLCSLCINQSDETTATVQQMKQIDASDWQLLVNERKLKAVAVEETKPVCEDQVYRSQSAPIQRCRHRHKLTLGTTQSSGTVAVWHTTSTTHWPSPTCTTLFCHLLVCPTLITTDNCFTEHTHCFNNHFPVNQINMKHARNIQNCSQIRIF